VFLSIREICRAMFREAGCFARTGHEEQYCA
jgi:hypothetical protein